VDPDALKLSPLFWLIVAAVWLLSVLRWRMRAQARIAAGELTRREADGIAGVASAFGVVAVGIAGWLRASAGIGDLPMAGAGGWPDWVAPLQLAAMAALAFWIFARGGDALLVRAFATTPVTKALLTATVVRGLAVVLVAQSAWRWFAALF
jgi:hypothetical protein